MPVLTGYSSVSWSFEENYCRSMLILHTPNLHSLKDTKTEDVSWIDKLILFLDSNDCPNFVKADVERVKQKINECQVDNEYENDQVSIINDEQPEWMELIHSCK